MHASDGTLLFAATDLSDFLACPQLSLLERRKALGGPEPPKFDDPGAEVLRQRGHEHEQRHLERLRAGGREVVGIEDPGPGLHPVTRWRELAERTLEAMRGGADVVYQGVLFDGTWVGRPDFLLRVEAPSDLGAWSYEVVDAKLAREAKGGAVLQLCVYSDLLTGVQGRTPEQVHLALGRAARGTATDGAPGDRSGTEPETFRCDDFAAYYRSVRSRLDAHLEAHAVGAPLPYAPDPVPHCDLCAWQPVCDRERRDVDHLSFVADLGRRELRALREREVTSLEALGTLELPLDPPLDKVSAPTLERRREQARIQLEGRRSGEPRYELFEEVVEDEGLAALPTPSPGDLFFDIEGDPYALGDGIEYLFGLVDADGEYTGFWALDRAEEKAAFEAFMDLVAARLERHPDLHIYHFGHYEPTHLKGLMGRHAAREDELDRLLRGKAFVDLHRVVRQSLRASVESYSIKKLEPLYGFTREEELRRANRALAHFEAWLELGGEEEGAAELLDSIERYNRDDCLSTVALREWLEARRPELEARTGTPVPRASPADPEPAEKVAEEGEEIARLVEGLTADFPAEARGLTGELPAGFATELGEEQRARLLLARLLGYYRREKKSTWWEYFRCLELSDEELIDDRATLGGLEYEGVIAEEDQSYVHRYRCPPQDHRIRKGGTRDPATERSPGTVVAIDDVRGTVDIKRRRTSDKPHPRALIPFDFIPDRRLRESLFRLARATIEHGVAPEHPNGVAMDALMRHRPDVGQADGAPLRRPDEPTRRSAGPPSRCGSRTRSADTGRLPPIPRPADLARDSTKQGTRSHLRPSPGSDSGAS